MSILMPVQKRKVTVFPNWPKSFKFLPPSRLFVQTKMFAVIISWELWSRLAETVRPCLASNTQVQDAPCGTKLSPCFCGLIKKHSCKRIAPLLPKKLSNHRVSLMMEALCVRGRRLVRHYLYCRLHHVALLQLLTVQIVQGRRTGIS